MITISAINSLLLHHGGKLSIPIEWIGLFQNREGYYVQEKNDCCFLWLEKEWKASAEYYSLIRESAQQDRVLRLKEDENRLSLIQDNGLTYSVAKQLASLLKDHPELKEVLTKIQSEK